MLWISAPSGAISAPSGAEIGRYPRLCLSAAGNGLAAGGQTLTMGWASALLTGRDRIHHGCARSAAGRWTRWGEGSSEPGPTMPGPTMPIGAGDGEVTQAFWGHPDTRPRLADPASPPPPPPTDVVGHGPAGPAPSSAGPPSPTVES